MVRLMFLLINSRCKTSPSWECKNVSKCHVHATVSVIIDSRWSLSGKNVSRTIFLLFSFFPHSSSSSITFALRYLRFDRHKHTVHAYIKIQFNIGHCNRDTNSVCTVCLRLLICNTKSIHLFSIYIYIYVYIFYVYIYIYIYMYSSNWGKRKTKSPNGSRE